VFQRAFRDPWGDVNPTVIKDEKDVVSEFQGVSPLGGEEKNKIGKLSL